MGSKLTYFCIGLVTAAVLMPIAIWFLGPVLWVASGRYDRDIVFWYDVEQLASVLVIFVEDHGRMPEDFQELEVKEYIVRREDGKVYPSESIMGRPTGLRGPRDMALERQERISVKYGVRPGQGGLGGLIAAPGASEFVRHQVDRCSAVLAYALLRASATRPSSTTAVPSLGK